MDYRYKNIKLKLAYDGSSFLGWQETKEGPSIEEELKKALFSLLQENVLLQAASRTDQGVHAEGQIAQFFLRHSNFTLPKLLHGLNSLLPKEIRVLEAVEMSLSFHPTLDARGKKYSYDLCLGPIQLPFHRNRSWHIHTPCNLEKMKEAALLFQGSHDFSSFCNARKNMNTLDKIRDIFSIEWIELPQNRIKIIIQGSHFLYKMVRNIVGTLVYVGIGKIKIEDLKSIIEAKKRSLSGVTAPAKGLTLAEVFYPEEI